MIKTITVPEKEIKFMCYNIFITIDNHVFDLSFKPVIERVVGSTYRYTGNGIFRSKKWFRKNCVNVLGYIYF